MIKKPKMYIFIYIIYQDNYLVIKNIIQIIKKNWQMTLEDPRMAKYFNWITDKYKGKKIAV